MSVDLHKGICEEKYSKILKLETAKHFLKQKVSKLEEKIDDNDAYEQRDTLALSVTSFPPISNIENCPQLACKLVFDILNENISLVDISVSHCFSNKDPKNQIEVHREIIVKFCLLNVKLVILSACRKSKPTNLFVNEFLTPARQTISYVFVKQKKSSQASSPERLLSMAKFFI